VAIRKRPPLFVKKKQPFGVAGPTFHVWACDARLTIARFQNRRQPRLSAVVHRSTKQPGKWQTTFFDVHGPSSDAQSGTCQEAVRELPPGSWRLRNVRPAR
jgi:hypothetical protein